MLVMLILLIQNLKKCDFVYSPRPGGGGGDVLWVRINEQT